jgi:hypothetical protein
MVCPTLLVEGIKIVHGCLLASTWSFRIPVMKLFEVRRQEIGENWYA